MNRKKVSYGELDSRQKENYNFAKFSAVMADYGYNCVRLTADYNDADIIAIRIDGTVLRIQLKARFTLHRQYDGKRLYVACPNRGEWYLYPHDKVRDHFAATGHSPYFHSRNIPMGYVNYMKKFKI